MRIRAFAGDITTITTPTITAKIETVVWAITVVIAAVGGVCAEADRLATGSCGCSSC
jgi:hypothetical protein